MVVYILYLQVIHYYDLNGNLQASIELIRNALTTCEFDCDSQSKLQRILFKSYLDLEYYDEAYQVGKSAFASSKANVFLRASRADAPEDIERTWSGDFLANTIFRICENASASCTTRILGREGGRYLLTFRSCDRYV